MEPEERKELPAPHNLPTGDFYLYPVVASIVKAEIRERTVVVEWSDSAVSEFHFLPVRWSRRFLQKVVVVQSAIITIEQTGTTGKQKET